MGMDVNLKLLKLCEKFEIKSLTLSEKTPKRQEIGIEVAKMKTDSCTLMKVKKKS